jgi:hypothetical protein
MPAFVALERRRIWALTASLRAFATGGDTPQHANKRESFHSQNYSEKLTAGVSLLCMGTIERNYGRNYWKLEFYFRYVVE